jgi:hypothetical protein
MNSKAIGDELAFAQENYTSEQIDITKENTLLHPAVVVTEQFVLLLVCPVKSGSKWRISLW